MNPSMPIRMVLMLAIGLMINYIDRGTISVAAPLLEKELGLSPAEMGWVLSAFFWAYVPMQPVMGWLADRIGAARVLAGGFTLWCVATVLTGLSHGVEWLVAMRLVMGIGESTFYPCAVSLLASRVDDRHRTRATGAVTLGGIVGPALGTFIGGVIMAQYGWQTMFIGLGLASLIWLIPWLSQLRRDERAADGAQADAEPGMQAIVQVSAQNSAQASARAGTRVDVQGPSLADILKQRALWSVMLGVFCSNYAFYFVFTSLPLYLVQDRHLTLMDMTHLTSWVYIVDGISILLTSWLLDAWIRRGASFNRAYKTTLIVSAIGVGTCLVACTGAGMSAAVALLLLLGFMDGMNNPITPAATQKFAGPQASGRWMGLQNAVANLSGVAAPVITGYSVQLTGQYTTALMTAGAVAFVGAFTWLVIVPPVRPVTWPASTAPAHATAEVLP